MNKKDRQFIKSVRSHLAKNNIKLVFGKGKKVRAGGFLCDGYFDENKKLIKVAKGDPAYLETLLHEYCHYIQWIRKTKIFKNSEKYCLIVENWLNGKQYDPGTIKRSFYWVRKMERECEQIAAKMIDKYELPINKEKYIQNANCYIYSHFFMEKTRKYMAFKRSPFNSKLVKDVMPTNFKSLSHKILPQKVYRAMSRCI